MNLFALTRALIDIDSTTGREREVGDFLFRYLEDLASRTGGAVERMPVTEDRFNVFAAWGEPAVVLSTHIDTVPPFFPSSEDDEHVRGRGACDTKGGIASMIHAIQELLAEGSTGLRPAPRGRRGDGQRGRPDGELGAAGLPLARQRRAHGEPAGPGLQGDALPGPRSRGAGGALGLSGAGRLRHRQAAGGAGAAADRAAPRTIPS